MTFSFMSSKVVSCGEMVKRFGKDCHGWKYCLYLIPLPESLRPGLLVIRSKPTTKSFCGRGEPSICWWIVQLGKNCIVTDLLMKSVEKMLSSAILKRVFCSFHMDDGSTRGLAIVYAAPVSKNAVTLIGSGNPSMNILSGANGILNG